VLFRLLNASPTQNITLALAGHRLRQSLRLLFGADQRA
jgi:hypothetical protein